MSVIYKSPPPGCFCSNSPNGQRRGEASKPWRKDKNRNPNNVHSQLLPSAFRARAAANSRQGNVPRISCVCVGVCAHAIAKAEF